MTFIEQQVPRLSYSEDEQHTTEEEEPTGVEKPEKHSEHELPSKPLTASDMKR